MSFFETLQNKSIQSRKRIALVCTIASYAVVVSVWVSSWDARFKNGGDRDTSLSPIAGISKVFNGFAAQAIGGFPGISFGVKNNIAVIISGNEQTASAGNEFDFSGIVVVDSF